MVAMLHFHVGGFSLLANHLHLKKMRSKKRKQSGKKANKIAILGVLWRRGQVKEAKKPVTVARDAKKLDRHKCRKTPVRLDWASRIVGKKRAAIVNSMPKNCTDKQTIAVDKK